MKQLGAIDLLRWRRDHPGEELILTGRAKDSLVTHFMRVLEPMLDPKCMFGAQRLRLVPFAREAATRINAMGFDWFFEECR